MSDAERRTRILAVNAEHPEPDRIAEAARLIRAGQLVAFPTETVYGLGANALDAAAVRGIFAAKERPACDPLIVHLADVEALPPLVAELPPQVERLAEAFWPGPLTLVLPRSAAIPDEVTAGGPTVALRIPAHPVARALIRAAKRPIAAPSANRFGRLSPTRAEDVLADLGGRIDLILDGGLTPVGVESTVLSLVTPVPTILRPGGISREALEAVLGAVAVRSRTVGTGEIAASPGTLPQHYAPRTPLRLLLGGNEAVLAAMRRAALEAAARGRRIGLLVAEEDLPSLRNLPAVIEVAGSLRNPRGVARQLYAALRRLDGAGVERILARDFGERGLGLAVRDRLSRAAGGDVVEVTE